MSSTEYNGNLTSGNRDMSNQKGSLKCQTFDIEVYKKTDKEVDRWNKINSISPNIIDTSFGKGEKGVGVW